MKTKGCCVHDSYNWWPLLNIIFYICAPLPLLVIDRTSDTSSEYSSIRNRRFALFITTGILTINIAVIIMMSTNRSLITPLISQGQAAFSSIASVVVNTTTLAFTYILLNQNESFCQIIQRGNTDIQLLRLFQHICSKNGVVLKILI
ncbi:hypothetical protein A3Q56_05289 [Intoshia linei]|uniref:Uncharacterized protein n=1 Tax=Intoshia linei TaxID=1819745 RepID=A0A177AY91_9BILA|nr:hypothetical protein A3Q56_05289 [Intoshia linei]